MLPLSIGLSVPYVLTSVHISHQRCPLSNLKSFEKSLINHGHIAEYHNVFEFDNGLYLSGRVAQSKTCLTIDVPLTTDPGVASSIPAMSHTFVETDHKIISTVNILPSADSFKKGCCQFQTKYVHELLVNHLFNLVQEKMWLGELTVPP